MGATSVTGKGLGGVDGKNKGSSRDTLGVGNLIGPRIVYAGSVTMTGSLYLVEYPTLEGVVGDYGFHLTGSAGNHVWVTSKTTSSFIIRGSSGMVISWTVVKNGY